MEGIVRLSAFFGIFLIMAIWEIYAPRRQLADSRWQRWSTNISLSILNILIIRFTVGAAALLAAVSAHDHGWGLLNVLALPNWLIIILTLVLLDLAIYGQHLASHKWRWLWQLHKIHHTDQEFDVTTAVRFHPLEIIISMCYKVLLIYFIGANPLAVIAFEIILSSCALFNHSNVRIPLSIDKIVRLILVTPDMHRVHHSVIKSETDSNYGFSISIWDRLFATYTDQPRDGHDNMEIGLTEYRHKKDVRFERLLLMPFSRRR
ncbi:MAG: sterol desaturase family protein [Gammaproteobacteria bacterium]|nr:MAG: sterol desaturase family protein [Gammaproteobacteria bacterium]